MKLTPARGARDIAQATIDSMDREPINHALTIIDVEINRGAFQGCKSIVVEMDKSYMVAFSVGTTTTPRTLNQLFGEGPHVRAAVFKALEEAGYAYELTNYRNPELHIRFDDETIKYPAAAD